jgi:hypothetical protein
LNSSSSSTLAQQAHLAGLPSRAYVSVWFAFEMGAAECSLSPTALARPSSSSSSTLAQQVHLAGLPSRAYVSVWFAFEMGAAECSLSPQHSRGRNATVAACAPCHHTAACAATHRFPPAGAQSEATQGAGHRRSR